MPQCVVADSRVFEAFKASQALQCVGVLGQCLKEEDRDRDNVLIFRLFKDNVLFFVRLFKDNAHFICIESL